MLAGRRTRRWQGYVIMYYAVAFPLTALTVCEECNISYCKPKRFSHMYGRTIPLRRTKMSGKILDSIYYSVRIDVLFSQSLIVILYV